MEPRYIANDMPTQTLDTPLLDLLQASLETILTKTPPRISYRECHLGGLYSGYTGLAYLFLRISALHPGLDILGHEPLYWAGKYLSGDRGDMKIEQGNCGLTCEKLSYQAVRACVTGDLEHVIEFISNIPGLIGPYASSDTDPFPSEMLNGRAGALYMLRMVRHWVPHAQVCIESPIHRLTQKILESDDKGEGRWLWHGKAYLGAAHGDIGIITQLVLANPALAPQLAGPLDNLLSRQVRSGWPSCENNGKAGPIDHVQWCHGAPGLIYALQALRPYFPALRPSFPHIREQIDIAIANAQDLVWRKGLLTKEPSLCHGIFGNALTLPRGPKREHFLALATPRAIEAVRQRNPQLFKPAAYGHTSSVMLNYAPSAAWAWAVCEKELPGMILFTDI